MIKKVLYTIGALMFISGFVRPWNGLAADDTSTCDKNPDAFKCAFLGKGLDWGNSFGATKQDNIGKNLYAIIYKKTALNTLEDAIKQTAEKYAMPPERMSLILGGDISPILEKNPLMSVTDASRIYNQIIDYYNSRKNSADLEAGIKAAVEPNEIFADGDLGNSGFDLVNDLDNLEIILFQRADLVSFGGDYNKKKSGDGASGGSKVGDLAGPVDLNLEGQPAGSVETGTGSDSSTKNPSDPVVLVPCKTEKSIDVVKKAQNSFLGGINPNLCFADDGIGKSLEDFAKKGAEKCMPSTDTQSGKAGSGLGGGGKSKDGAENSGNGTDNGDLGLGAEIGAGDNPSGLPDVEPAKADDWSKDPLCGDIFCMTLEFVKGPVTPTFKKTDNCIQCHVQYINDSLQKTISHNLIPSKASGNLGENSLCKNAAVASLGAIGMNINIAAVPIVTPVKNYSDVQLDLGFSKNGKEYVNKTTREWDLYKCKQDPEECNKEKVRAEKAKADGTAKDNTPVDKTDRAIQITVQTVSDGASQESVLTKSRKIEAVDSSVTVKEAITVQLTKTAYGQAESFNALDKEMKQMNQFFQQFSDQMNSLSVKVPGLNSSLSCSKLKEKKACT